MKKAFKQAGFTMIEMMIVVAILAIIFSMAMPSYRVWIENTRIRNAAESIQNGMQQARTEALQRNALVRFTLNGNTTRWQVGCVTVVADNDGDGKEDCPAVIHQRTTVDNSTTLTTTPLPGGTSVITYNGIGSRVAIPAAPELTSVTVDNTSIAAADSRELRVTIGVGGNVKMCDPNLPAGDLRRC